MTTIRTATGSGASALLQNLLFRVTFVDSLSAPTTLLEVQTNEEQSLSAVPAVSYPSNLETILNTSHSTAGLSAAYQARHSCVIITDGSGNDVELLATEEMNQTIDPGSTITTTHTFEFILND